MRTNGHRKEGPNARFFETSNASAKGETSGWTPPKLQESTIGALLIEVDETGSLTISGSLIRAKGVDKRAVYVFEALRAGVVQVHKIAASLVGATVVDMKPEVITRAFAVNPATGETIELDPSQVAELVDQVEQERKGGPHVEGA